MAFFNVSFHSDALGKACGMNVIVPQKTSSQIGMASSGGRKSYPVLYLLHGLSDDHTIWCRRTSIERYAADKNLIVVMPDGGRSFYADMDSGARYWTFISSELPEIVSGFFPCSTRREDTFVAGLSMGGYGALKLALNCPDRFSVCGAFSPVANMAGFLDWMDSHGKNVEADGLFGASRIVPDDCDLHKLIRRAAELPAGSLPKICQYCGVDDFLYQDNVHFRDAVRNLGCFDYTYEEGPGAHEWGFWDDKIRHFLNELPLQK